MHIRHVTSGDLDQIYSLFQERSITKKDIRKNPKTGFYEYPLTEEAMKVRLDEEFSLILDKNGKIECYIIAYPSNKIKDILKVKTDSVLEYLTNNLRGIYIDQIVLPENAPLHNAGQLMAAWHYIAHGEKIENVCAAIPEKPWFNLSSTRFAIAHGFKRIGAVSEPDVTLGMWKKEYYLIR
jgi:hypothetical protein